MEAVFVHEGKCIDFTPSADVPAGTVVVQGELVGIAKCPIAADTLGALAIEGVFDIAKADEEELAVGTLVYWDDALNQVTSIAGGHKRFGIVVRAAAASDATVRVKLVQLDTPLVV